MTPIIPNTRDGPTLWFRGPLKVCSGCKWHEVTMIRSGRPALYHHYCHHPSIAEKSTNLETDRFIGQSPETPQWCPAPQPAAPERRP